MGAREGAIKVRTRTGYRTRSGEKEKTDDLPYQQGTVVGATLMALCVFR